MSRSIRPVKFDFYVTSLIEADGRPRRIVEVAKPYSNGVMLYHRDWGLKAPDQTQGWRAPSNDSIAPLIKTYVSFFESNALALFGALDLKLSQLAPELFPGGLKLLLTFSLTLKGKLALSSDSLFEIAMTGWLPPDDKPDQMPHWRPYFFVWVHEDDSPEAGQVYTRPGWQRLPDDVIKQMEPQVRAAFAEMAASIEDVNRLGA